MPDTWRGTLDWIQRFRCLALAGILTGFDAKATGTCRPSRAWSYIWGSWGYGRGLWEGMPEEKPVEGRYKTFAERRNDDAGARTHSWVGRQQRWAGFEILQELVADVALINLPVTNQAQ